MPAKITLDITNNQTGEISVTDVHRMLTDFRAKVDVSCTDPSRNPIVKRFHFDLDIERIKKILENVDADSRKVRIYMSLNMPSQLNCHNNASVENHLSIIVSALSSVDKSPLLSPGSSILVDGFKDHNEFAINALPDDSCCVQGSPFIIA